MRIQPRLITLVLIFCWSIISSSALDTSNFAVGIWSVPLDQFDSLGNCFELVANPFSATDSSTAKTFFDTCQKHGLSGIAGVDCQSLADATYLNGFVNGIKNHPSYSALMLYDEPLSTSQWCQPVSVQLCQTAYSIIKSADSVHPVFIDDYATNAATSPVVAYKNAYDFFTDDNYAVCTDGTLAIYRSALAYYYLSASPKPWISLIQLHDMGGGYFTMPTPLEERIITYMPIVAGAKGIMFYSFDDEAKAVDNPVLWAYVKKLAGELKTLKPILASQNLENTVTITPSTAKIGASIKKYQDKYYLIAYNYAHTGTLANTNNNPVAQAQSNIKFTISGLSGGSIRTIGSAGLSASDSADRILSLTNGSFTDAFDPFAVNVYEITPAVNAMTVGMREPEHGLPFTVLLTPQTLTVGLVPCNETRHLVSVELFDCLGRILWRSESAWVSSHEQAVSWHLHTNAFLHHGLYLLRVNIDNTVKTYFAPLR